MNSRPMHFVILAACLTAALATTSYYSSAPLPVTIALTPAAVVLTPAPTQPKPPAPQATKLGSLIKELSKFDAYSENDQEEEELKGVQESIVSYLSEFEGDDDGECDDDEAECDSKSS